MRQYFVIPVLLVLLFFSGCTAEPTITDLSNGNTKYESTLHGGYSFEFPSDYELVSLDEETGEGFAPTEFFEIVAFDTPDDSRIGLMMFMQGSASIFDLREVCTEEALEDLDLEVEEDDIEMEVVSHDLVSVGQIKACRIEFEGKDDPDDRGLMVLGKCNENFILIAFNYYKVSSGADPNALRDLLASFDC